MASVLVTNAQITVTGWSDGSTQKVGKTIGYGSNGYWGLQDASGKKISFLIYSDLFPIGDEYLVGSKYSPVHKRKLYGIIDEKGKVKIGFNYTSITKQWDQIKVTTVEGLSGIIRLPNTFVLEAKFHDIAIRQHFFITSDQKNKKSIFSHKGEKLSTNEYDIIGGTVKDVTKAYSQNGIDQIDIFGNITSLISGQSSEKGKVEYTEKPYFRLLDSMLLPLVDLYYNDVAFAPGGVLKAYGKEFEKLITYQDEMLVAGKDIDISATYEGKLAVSVDGKWGVLNAVSKDILLPFDYDSTWIDGIAIYAQKCDDNSTCFWSIFNHKGEKINATSLQAALPASEGLIAAKKNDYWGFYSANGAVNIPFKFDSVGGFINNHAIVKYVNQYGVIDRNGQWTIPPHHLCLERLSENLFKSVFNTRKNVINEYNNTIFTSYYDVQPHRLGFTESIDGGLTGLFDKQGSIIGDRYYRGSHTLNRDSIVVFYLEDGEYVWDVTRNHSITDELSQIEAAISYGEGLISIKKQGRFGAVDLSGRLIVANRYDSILPSSQGQIPIKIGDKWGVIDASESLVIQPEFTSMGCFVDNISIVSKYDKVGAINRKGKVVIPFDYRNIVRTSDYFFIGARGNRLYLLNRSGSILSSDNDLIISLNNHYFLTKYHLKWGLVSEIGRTLLPNTYTSIDYNSETKAYLIKH